MKTLRHLRWFGMVFILAVMACTTTVPPRELILRNDHEGLAAWYEQEASRLRGKAQEMRQMADLYAKSSSSTTPKRPTRPRLWLRCIATRTRPFPKLDRPWFLP